MEVTRVNDFDCIAFFRVAHDLGWGGDTQIYLYADHYDNSIRITRRDSTCTLCGSFAGERYHLHGRAVCAQCLAELQEVQRQLYRGNFLQGN